MLGRVVQSHLLGDGGQSQELRFPPPALDMVFLGVAVTAECLHGVIDRLDPGLRG